MANMVKKNDAEDSPGALSPPRNRLVRRQRRGSVRPILLPILALLLSALLLATAAWLLMQARPWAP